MSKEIIDYAEGLAKEKNVSKENVLKILEEAIKEAIENNLEDEDQIKINRKSGEIEVINEEKKKCTISRDFNRVEIFQIRKFINKEMSVLAQQMEYTKYKTEIGQIITGSFLRSDFNNSVLNVEGALCLLTKKRSLPQDHFNQGEKVLACIENVHPIPKKGYQIYLSRTSNEFLHKLLKREVPEIQDGTIEIQNIVRDPGSKSKVAIRCSNEEVDPIGCIIGVRGSRIRSIVDELKGEKIDIIKWNEDKIELIASCFNRINIVKVIMDQEEKDKVTVVVSDDQLSSAIGRNGQNVSLIGKLIGLKIKVVGESEEKNKQAEEYKEAEKRLLPLEVSNIVIQFLINEGFTSIEEINFADEEEIANVEGIGENLAKKIKEKADAIYEKNKKVIFDQCLEMNVEKKLFDMLVKYFQLDEIQEIVKNIKNTSELAALSNLELQELLPKNSKVSQNDLNEAIIEARNE